jgi:Ca2+/Na+ antiporter
MFVFAFIQGMIALLYPFSADPAEYVRDCCFYITGIFLVAYVLYDGAFTLMEGVLFLCLYALYVTVVVTFDHVRERLGLMDTKQEEEDSAEKKEQEVSKCSLRPSLSLSRHPSFLCACVHEGLVFCVFVNVCLCEGTGVLIYMYVCIYIYIKEHVSPALFME